MLIVDNFKGLKVSEIRFRTMCEEVISIIRKSIMNGEFKPGSKLVESDLASQFNISRGPIREALMHLKHEGLLEHFPNRGYYVRTLAPDDVWEIFLICYSLQKIAFELSGNRLKDETILKMEKALIMMENDSAGSMDVFFNADDIFHTAIIENYNSPMINNLWKHITTFNIALILMEKNNVIDLKLQLERHKKVLETLKEGNLEKGDKIIFEHYEEVKKRIYL